MKTLLFIQNNPNFPFPGNGDVNPPGKPFEPGASIDMYNYYILAFILLACIAYFAWDVYTNYKKQNL